MAATIEWRTQNEIEHTHKTNAILATQHAASCLAHVEALLKTIPEALVFILVRNPLTTLAQWSDSPALKNAGLLETDRLAGVHAPNLAEHRRQQLAELQKLNEPMMRRAGLWNYFAGLADTHDERIQIIRYEDVLEHPAVVLAHLGATLFAGQELALPNVDAHFQKKEDGTATLTEQERECLRAACSYNAGAFDYDLYAD